MRFNRLLNRRLKRQLASFLLILTSAVWLVPEACQAAEDLAPLLHTIQQVGREGTGNVEVAKAWQQLSAADVSQIPTLLAALDHANPLAANWIRGAIEVILDRQLKSGGKLPAQELEAFLHDTRHAPRARRMAFEWLTIADPTAPDRLIPGMIQDPSVEMRRDAVERLLLQANKHFDAKEQDAARRIYRQALAGARDLDQITLIDERLAKLEDPVDLPLHFGFIQKWSVIGPFDNRGTKGFHVAYDPEREIDLAAQYDGKETTVTWHEAATDDRFGKVDLNKAVGKHSGAVAYVVNEFRSDRQQPVELRYGTPNATKAWINGELLGEFSSYHTNNQIDQYIVRGTLKPGRNLILLKVCQNEQTEDWAQVWEFQLRVCDAAGTAVLSVDRTARREATTP